MSTPSVHARRLGAWNAQRFDHPCRESLMAAFRPVAYGCWFFGIKRTDGASIDHLIDADAYRKLID
ncbi:hypothetical protein [Streptomyces capoamus]|uniref:hypothetical protein n=1 Tax=Streptomyces capoamus TaxID=68183 RepID=UPI003399F168